tara:strand:+ start:382 stop:1038 length:657 start_codon:yes stop_codon:yes gene_type:complete
MKSDIKIAPSILSANFSKLGEEIKLLDESSCDYIHIDIMDGHFVPNITFGPDLVKSLRSLTKKKFDVHLMMNPVSNFIDSFSNAGADIITIHEEISEDVLFCLKQIKKSGIKAGISIKPCTPSKKISKFLNFVDLVLVMTVEPGFGGQKFLYSQLKKIKEVKELIGKRKIDIEVDGGINIENAKETIKAGANILVSGSTIFKEKNYQKKILEFKKIKL